MRTQLPSPKMGTAPNFQPISVADKWLHGSRCHLYGGRPQPRRLCVRWEPTYALPQKGAEPIPLNFRPMSIVAKRLDTSKCHLYGGRPQPRGPCVTWGHPAPAPKKGEEPPPQFSAHVVAKRLDGSRWHLGLGLGYIVVDEDPAPSPQKGAVAPNF